MKRIIFISILSISLVLSSYILIKPSKVKIRTIVIDAGHGGKDPGCPGGDVSEKQITLDIALKLGKLIEDSLKDVKVIYTRKNDQFVELVERSTIANKNNADLFISIHCNSNPNNKIHGTESYVMGIHKNESNLDVSKRENSSILMEEGYQENYEGFDPSSPEAHIIFSLFQNVFLDQSLSFADKVERQFRYNSKLASRGVKQAGFLVLWKTSMPSILIETGFLSNPGDRLILKSEAGKKQVAHSIFRAIKDYGQVTPMGKSR